MDVLVHQALLDLQETRENQVFLVSGTGARTLETTLPWLPESPITSDVGELEHYSCFQSSCFTVSGTGLCSPPHAAHGLLRDVVRDSEDVARGPPGPPGPPGTPGHSRWFGTSDNVLDMVEYLKCEQDLL